MSDDETPTLYNPPSDEPSPLVDGDDAEVSLSVPLPVDVYRRLQAVAQQVGLPADVVAARAIEMICDELPQVAALSDADATQDLSTQELIDRYQSRLDLLQATQQDDDEE